MRWTAALVGLMGLTARPAAAQRVAGRIVILERDAKPSPDLGAAVLYLEGPLGGAAVGGAAGGAGAASPGVPVTVDISINDKVYVPRVVVAPVGSTVRFPNLDPFKHNVFSVNDPNDFDLGLYGRGESRSVTLKHPGLVRIYCNVHPRMVAYAVMAANRHFTQPGVDGSFAIADVAAGRYRLHVWHERIVTEVVKDVVVPAAGVRDLLINLNARGYRWQPHRNKYGREYPTSAGRERY